MCGGSINQAPGRGCGGGAVRGWALCGVGCAGVAYLAVVVLVLEGLRMRAGHDAQAAVLLTGLVDGLGMQDQRRAGKGGAH